MLQLLTFGSVVSSEEFAETLGVSRETVRRDLARLEAQGRLSRVHGGATAAGRVVGSEPPFTDRSQISVAAKKAIGRCAAGLVKPGMTVMIDVGTTALEVARALPDDHEGLVVTCSLVAAVELSSRPNVEILVSGGRVRPGDLALSSALTLDFFSQVNPDLAFLGSGGVAAHSGLTDFYLDEAATRRLVVARAGSAYVLADHDKLGRTAAHHVCGLDRIDGLITDVSPDAPLRQALDEAGTELLVAT